MLQWIRACIFAVSIAIQRGRSGARRIRLHPLSRLWRRVVIFATADQQTVKPAGAARAAPALQHERSGLRMDSKEVVCAGPGGDKSSGERQVAPSCCSCQWIHRFWRVPTSRVYGFHGGPPCLFLASASCNRHPKGVLPVSAWNKGLRKRQPPARSVEGKNVDCSSSTGGSL
jgi:hypothetical protein